MIEETSVYMSKNEISKKNDTHIQNVCISFLFT